MDPHIRKEVSLDSKAVHAGSRPNSCVNSRVGSRENLCEECIQNPLDLIDASIQVDLSDSENDWGSDEEGGPTTGGGKGGGGADDVTMGKRRGGELGVNKKGTPLYSREDIREQYCINDKELQVLDRQANKGLFGCFSNQGQAGFSPCSGKQPGKKSILSSCIARTSSEEELQQQLQTKRPISPGLRSTTWNGQRYGDQRPDEDDGFDEQYFRRRPKSFCVPPAVPPQGRYLPPGVGPQMVPGGPQPIGIPTSGMYPDPRLQISMASLAESEQQQRMMAYGSHPMLRNPAYPPTTGHPQSMQPVQPMAGPAGGNGYGYTLPPTAAYFPVSTYSGIQPQQTTILDVQPPPMMMHDGCTATTATGMNQPNTPDLLMHRRQAGTPEVSLDDRKQKHVSFDSSSLMRSQTLATMDEASYHRNLQQQQQQQLMQQQLQQQQQQPPVLPMNQPQSMGQPGPTPSKSFERLIDGRSTPDFEYFNQVLPPEIARQIMLDRLKRNSMRTQATQTDVNNAAARNRHSSHIPISPKTAHKVFMVSEGVQTNGFNNGTSLPTLPVGYQGPPPMNFQVPPPPLATATATSPIRSTPSLEYTSPAHRRSITATTSAQLPTSCQHQVYHLDERDGSGHGHKGKSNNNGIQHSEFAAWSYVNPPMSDQQQLIYGTSPRPPKDVTSTTYSGDLRSAGHKRAARSMSQGDMLEPEEIHKALMTVQMDQQRQQQHQHPHRRQQQQQQQHHQHYKTQESPQRRRVPGGVAVHHIHGHHHHHHHHRQVSSSHQHHRLQKSHSDGELIDDEEDLDGRRRHHVANKDRGQHFRSCKGVKFSSGRHETSPHQHPPQQHPVSGLVVPTSEEEVSDRDLPELAPIVPPPTAPKPVVQQPNVDDLEADLGAKLSPLGSTSSLQDLIESNSAGEVASESQNSFSWTTLERQRKAKENPEDSLMPEETADNIEHLPQHEQQQLEVVDAGVGNRNNLSITEGETSEEAEEHVTSYLEQPPLKILEKKFTEDEEEANEAASRKSSSSGSYSVTSALAGQQLSKSDKPGADLLLLEGRLETPDAALAPTLHDQQVNPEPSPVEDKSVTEVEPSRPTPVTLRKQELTLDLQKDTSAAASTFRAPIDITSSFSPDESASENSLMWQRLPMGTGDVQKKREVFERQIRTFSDEKPKALNGKVKTPSSGAVRKIVDEERAVVGSPMGGPSGLARSPAMHSGFRTEDWKVERTPVNTPVSDRVLVGMINLSDDEAGSSEDLCKSSGATTPQGSINSNSMAPSSSMGEVAKSALKENPEPETEEVILSSSSQHPEEKSVEPVKEEPEMKNEDEAAAVVSTVDEEHQPEVKPNGAATTAAAENQPALMAPPAGFGDSPEHKPRQRLSGFHEPIADQVCPPEELLFAEDFAPPASLPQPTMMIAETFTAEEALPAGKRQSIQQPMVAEQAVTTTTNVQVLPSAMVPTVVPSSCGEPVTPQTPATSTEPPPTKRKLSSSSAASRTSGHSGHRSRSRSRSKERLLSKLAHSGEIKISTDEDDDFSGLYNGAYDRTAWAFIGKLTASSKSDNGSQPGQLKRSESIESTQSEREFRKKYQAITHRMVHRKSSAVMYSRILERTFECNKTVRVRRVRGEFGFRIHGSRPVVVSAIEPNTPAESSGLEVGDIILTINGVNVLDLPHTEVVKTAQAGTDELELGLARVPELSYPEDPIDVALGRFDESQMTLHAGYLWKLSRTFSPETGANVAKWSRRFFVLRADSCLYFFKQENESRPLGAILVSGCTILEGCDAEDQQSGLGRNYSFRLIFAFPPARPPLCPHKAAAATDLETYYSPKIMCLATDTKEELTPWLNVIDHCAQIQENSEDLWRTVSEQRQSLPANHFPRPDCRGYLLKLDGHSRTWKRRFCVLADACLYLYAHADAPSAYATLFLHGYRVQSTGALGSTKRHAFELIPPEQGMKFFYFLAETETEKKRWLASLEYSMDRWMKLL